MFIVDFPIDFKIEAEVIQCFKGEEDNIMFSWVDPNEEDLKENIQWAKNPWIGIKEPKFVVDQQQLGTTEKIIHRVYYYVVENYEELIKQVEDQLIIICFYIVNKEKHINEYKYRLSSNEHHVIEEDGYEHRSLFIETNDKLDFTERVLPKLQVVMKKYDLELMGEI